MGKVRVLNILFARENCSDPIDTCGAMCGNQLLCGLHYCSINCHDGICPPCGQVQSVECRFKRASLQIPCGSSTGSTFICDKVWQKTNKCRIHRCGETCNSKDKDHVCQLICGKYLQCNRHRCQSICHGSTYCPDCHLCNENFLIDQGPAVDNPAILLSNKNICNI